MGMEAIVEVGFGTIPPRRRLCHPGTLGASRADTPPMAPAVAASIIMDPLSHFWGPTRTTENGRLAQNQLGMKKGEMVV